MGASAIQWAFRKLQEKRAIQQAQQARDRARLEALRTGRPAPDKSEDERAGEEQAAVRTRLEELAERRRRQIEAMRQRQAQASTQQTARPGTPTSASPRPGPRRAGTSPPHTTAPTTQRGIPTHQAQSPQRLPQQRPSQRPTPRRTIPTPVTAQPAHPAPPIADIVSAIQSPAYSRERPSSTSASEPAATAGRTSIGKLDRAALRRGIIISELLSPPIALRQPTDESA